MKNEPVTVAIIRKVRAGREAEFEAALHEFIQQSLNEPGQSGVHVLSPPPGSGSREYGILRTFAGEAERDAFYESPVFKAWGERARMLTEGDPVYRKLHGLEAWFRTPGVANPPKWKMALLTWIAVWPVSMAVPAALNPLIGRSVPKVIFSGAVAAGIVLILTWGAMPLLATVARHWLLTRPGPIEVT